MTETPKPSPETAAPRPWADPNHPTNKLRPRVRCVGCGTKGCVTNWGPWCFTCNVARMTRLNAQFEKLAEGIVTNDQQA